MGSVDKLNVSELLEDWGNYGGFEGFDKKREKRGDSSFSSSPGCSGFCGAGSGVGST